MSENFIAILMGSDSDFPIMSETVKVLKTLNIPHEVRVTSAHRTPDDTRAYILDAEKRGCTIFIAAAGMAAHLAGAVAAYTVKPVIGVPIDATLHGLDSLLSTVQMPGGVPVATVAIGKAGAKNAGYLAAQMLAIADPELGATLRQEREARAADVQAKNAALQLKLSD